MKMRCPHCEAWAYVRNSLQVTRLTRQAVFVCNNAECGHTFSVVSEVVHTISPSATPDPTVRLPISRNTQRALLQQQLQTMPVAEHVAMPANGREPPRPRTLDLFAPDPHPG